MDLGKKAFYILCVQCVLSGVLPDAAVFGGADASAACCAEESAVGCGAAALLTSGRSPASRRPASALTPDLGKGRAAAAAGCGGRPQELQGPPAAGRTWPAASAAAGSCRPCGPARHRPADSCRPGGVLLVCERHRFGALAGGVGAAEVSFALLFAGGQGQAEAQGELALEVRVQALLALALCEPGDQEADPLTGGGGGRFARGRLAGLVGTDLPALEGR